MIRWTLTVLTVLLLAVWLASGRWIVGWNNAPSDPYVSIGINEGGLGVLVCRNAVDNLIGSKPGFFFFDRMGSSYRLIWRPYYSRRAVGTSSWTAVHVPLWIPATITGLLAPFLWRRHLRKRRRARLNLCPNCGYDLTGLPPGENDAPTCPECGA